MSKYHNRYLKIMPACLLWAAIAWLAAFSPQVAGATACEVSLPDYEITMTVDVNEYDACDIILQNNSYLDTTFSGITGNFSVENGVYSGFCADLNGDILDYDYFKATYKVRLYSSTNPPIHLQGIPWNKVNYILNQWQEENWNWLEVQAAIWTLVHGCDPGINDPYYPLWTCPDFRDLPFPYGPATPYGCPPYDDSPDVNLASVRPRE